MAVKQREVPAQFLDHPANMSLDLLTAQMCGMEARRNNWVRNSRDAYNDRCKGYKEAWQYGWDMVDVTINQLDWDGVKRVRKVK